MPATNMIVLLHSEIVKPNYIRGLADVVMAPRVGPLCKPCPFKKRGMARNRSLVLRTVVIAVPWPQWQDRGGTLRTKALVAGSSSARSLSLPCAASCKAVDTRLFSLERAAGIEPATLAWKARALPLCNARGASRNGGQGWIRTSVALSRAKFTAWCH